jgi:predicted CxxxxCH...CXXCH cytochrome family protein
MSRFRVVVWVPLLLLGGCGEVRRPPTTRSSGSATYRDQIKPLLEARCVRCHGGADGRRDALYDLSSYVGVMGPGTDETRNAIAGDESSLLLKKLDAADPLHWGYLLPQQSELRAGESAETRRAADLAVLRRWVLVDKLAYFDVLVHPPTWLYPGTIFTGAGGLPVVQRDQPEFHGGYLRRNGWSYDACTGCHGNDLRGGTSGRSCFTCHRDGVDSCTTCHGSLGRAGSGASAPPADLSWNLGRASRGVGAHQVHLAKRGWWAEISCDDCHRVPTAVRDAEHLTSSDGRAELKFGARAALLEVQPAYNASTGSCTVYCHGAAFLGIGQGKVPSWTKTGEAACGTCHKVPAVAGGPDCSTCHQQSVTPCVPSASSPACLPTGNGIGVAFTTPGLHGDGRYPLGRAGSEGTCHACHGTQASFGAPGPDLHGNTAISEVTVGLHAVHLADSVYRKALSCDSCHLVPAAIGDKGHFDSDLPAEVTFGALARGTTRNGAVDYKPTWDRTSGQCGNVYCHSLSGASVKQWKWTAPSTLGCGSCHGQPPSLTSSGAQHPPVADCKSCHSSAYDGSGKLDATKHINGRVDL